MQKGKSSEQSFAYWMLTTMFAEGNEQWALDYIRKNWGEQTSLPSFNGAWHEGWNLPWGATSHAWSSGPTALLSQKILGLEPTGYGWKTFQVKPVTADLMWAKGTVATVAGDISAAWKKSAGDHFSLNLNVPKGTTANVYLPAPDQKSIKINRRTLIENPAIKFHTEEDGKWGVLTIGAGQYQFECEIKEK